MKTIEKTMVTVVASINAPVEKVWVYWTDPKHIIHWNHASEDWHTPEAQNNLRIGGKFVYRMESKDGSQGFDFSGTYKKIVLNKQLLITLDDGREVRILFSSEGHETLLTETFEAESENSVELQRQGWQAILNNFKNYVETPRGKDTMHFEISINSNAATVYEIMLNAKTYQEWTSVFNPTSHYEGSWETGEKILFLGIDKDGNSGGMISRIKENTPDKYVCIEHTGVFRNGKKVTSGKEVDQWIGSLECYTFNENKGKTLLSIDLETPQPIGKEFKTYFRKTWPKALNRLKTLCETES